MVGVLTNHTQLILVTFDIRLITTSTPTKIDCGNVRCKCTQSKYLSSAQMHRLCKGLLKAPTAHPCEVVIIISDFY